MKKKTAVKLAQFLRSFQGVPQLRHTAIYRGAPRSQGSLISSPENPNNQLEFDAVVQCKREAIITMCVCACSNQVYSFAYTYIYIYVLYSHDLHLYLLYTIRHGNIRSILHSYMFFTLFFLHDSESNTFINANSPAFFCGFFRFSTVDLDARNMHGNFITPRLPTWTVLQAGVCWMRRLGRPETNR